MIIKLGAGGEKKANQADRLRIAGRGWKIGKPFGVGNFVHTLRFDDSCGGLPCVFDNPPVSKIVVNARSVPIHRRAYCEPSSQGFFHHYRLPFNLLQGAYTYPDSNAGDKCEGYIHPKRSLVVKVLVGGSDDPYIGLNVLLLFGLEGCTVCLIWRSRRDWRGWVCGIIGLLCLVRLGVSATENDYQEREYGRCLNHYGKIVTQKPLTAINYRNTLTLMANVLSTDKQIAAISALAEGSSIRSIERMTVVHRDTVMRLGVRVGQGCARLLDGKMRDLPCRYLQLDEIWGFIGKKERHVRIDDNPEYGDIWTFCAIDAETKLVPAFKCGKRDITTAKAFVGDLAGRLTNRVQISSDALRAYVDAIDQTFGTDVDFGQIVKTYEHDHSWHPEHKYSAPKFVAVEKRPVIGNPDMGLVSTSYIERLNATTRLHMRRLTRLTLAFSKKRENFEAAVALHFAYYNLVKRHNTLRCTPARAPGVERDFWSVAELLEAAA
jgi:IS1 family transposase